MFHQQQQQDPRTLPRAPKDLEYEIQQQIEQNKSQPPLNPPPLMTAEPEYLIVLHDFDSRSDDELTLRKGEHILVLETDQGFGDGWYIVS